MQRRIFLFLILYFSFYIGSVFSQTSRWENFTDYKNVIAVASDPNNSFIYAGSKGGLFVLDQSSGNVVSKYTNLNGLLSIDITSMYLDNNEKLWIGAQDGSISILDISSGTWRYIFDIKNSTESNKSINAFIQYGNFMFIATGYGIHKIQANDFRFIDAPYTKLGNITINTSVNSLTISGNTLFAATKSGIGYANIVSSNLNDPASWANYTVFPMNADVQSIEEFDGKVFAGSTKGFVYYNATKWSPYPNPSVDDSVNIKSIKAVGENLYFIANDFIYSANRSNLSSITQFNITNSYTFISKDNSLNPIAGTLSSGVLVKIGNQYSFVYPNSPFTNNFNHLAIDGSGNIWAAGGTPTAGFYMFNGIAWENFNTATHPEIGNSNWYQKIFASNDKVWALSFGNGLTLIENGNVIQNFNTSNSNLPGSGDPNFSVPFGAAVDNSGVFWFTFFLTNQGKSLYAYSGGNTFIGFNNPSILSGATAFTEMAVDSYNTKWIIISNARNGVYFFNENGTLNNPADDIWGFYTMEEFTNANVVTDLIVEKNNEVWISSNNGVFIIRNPLAAIQNPNQKPRPEKLGIISGGLRVPFTENCTSITGDIINDKWVGTETNGVFHLSSDGNTLIEQFNTTNSPILSNRVVDIKVSNESGRAYFATLNGLSSYSTDAIEPVAEFGKITVSPNPYLVPSATNLKIDGLVENSKIKIVKLNGEVITEFNSPGGRIATWNGLDDNNNPVSSGIYIIIAFKDDGSQVGTGKVAIVRK